MAELNVLDSVRIASPCGAAWDRMEGDERVRFCEGCGRNVYNLSAMSGEEAEALLHQREGRLCTRIYRRRDGTVLTADCPAGLRTLRRRILARIGFAGFIGALLSSRFFSARAAGVRDWLPGPLSDWSRTGSEESGATLGVVAGE